jgi:hypothetical protein
VSLAPADRVRRRRLRGALALIVVLAWGAALTGLVQRDILRTPAERFAEIALRVNPGNVFYEVGRAGKRVGYASSTIDTAEAGDTLWIRDERTVEVTGDSGPSRAIRRSEVSLSRAFAFRGSILDVDSGDVLRRTTVRAQGDSVLSVVVETNGVASDTQLVRTSGVVMMPEMLPLAMILLKTPEVGRQSSFTAFDPESRALRDVSLRILAESLFTVDDSARMDFKSGRFVSALTDTVRAWRVVEGADSGGGQWLDAQGRVVNSTANGLRFRRMAYELSFENWRLDALVTDTATNGDDIVLTPFDVRISPRGPGAQVLVARLIAPSLSDFDLVGGRQKVLPNGNVTVSRERDIELRYAPYSLPPDARFRTQHREYLQAEPYLQVRVPAMLRQGIAIIRNEREPAEIVRLLTHWVSDSVVRTTQPGDPSAIAILKTKSGDASGHAQLFTALARSLDIPTRIVSGAVRIDGRFYFHTWAEVFLNDWVAVDPTFGQFPADAGHLRLLIGGFERQSALKRRMRSLHIEVIHAQ